VTDLTFEDLAAEVAGDDEPDEPDDAGGGEWVREVFDRLDERGYLDALMAQQLDLDPGAAGVEATPDGGGEGAADLGAEEIARFGKLVIDNVGDVPVSTVVQYAENNPDTVDALVTRALGDDGGGQP
jgi:hypothetical protein